MFEDAELSGVLSLAGRKLKTFPTGMADKYDISDLVAAGKGRGRMRVYSPPACPIVITHFGSLPRVILSPLCRPPRNSAPKETGISPKAIGHEGDRRTDN